MSSLLSFISSFGSSAELRSLSPEQLRECMQQQGLTEKEISVILSGDRSAIATMVKTSRDIVCLILPTEPDKKENEDDGNENDKKDSIKVA